MLQHGLVVLGFAPSEETDVVVGASRDVRCASDGSTRLDGVVKMLVDQTLETVSWLRELCQVSSPGRASLADREELVTGGARRLRRTMLETL